MEIGGYFELELNSNSNPLHETAYALNTGRNALEFILRHLAVKKIFIPYYTCDVVLEPIDKLALPYEWYTIDEQFEIATPFQQLEEGVFILYTNYFGLKDEYIELISEQYKGHLIIDNAQALFSPPISGIPTFYSPRKLLGLPDGGFAYLETDYIDKALYQVDQSYDRCAHLLKRLELSPMAGYADFGEIRKILGNQPIKWMSTLTKKLMTNVKMEPIKQRRVSNFNYLQDALNQYNALEVLLSEQSVPMVYPLLIKKDGLRKRLIEHNIFIATYWPNVLEWSEPDSLEYALAKYILPLSIDQRYDINHMQYIVSVIKKLVA